MLKPEPRASLSARLDIPARKRVENAVTSAGSENAPETGFPAGQAATDEYASSERLASSHRRDPANKSKKDQLLALIAKSGGARISVLTERLGWQPHTVRAALSGLRKKGHQILASKAPKTGEAVYRLMPPAKMRVDDPEVLAP